MRSRAAFLIAILLMIAAGPALADRRVALVIGNSAYHNAPKLANPANDASAIAELLQRAGFDLVESKRDLANTDMRRVLREFSAKSRDADVAVVFFAGHGIEIDGQNYLLPTDTLLANDTDAFDEAIQLDRVLQIIEPARKLRLVILDACRDNPFARTMKRTMASRALGRGLAGVEPGRPNTLIAFAAKGGSSAADGAGSNSPFTTALLRHLTTPGLDLRQAFGRVRDDVMKATDSKQEPFVYGSLGGATVALVPAAPAQSAAPAASTQPAANPQAEVRRDYELALQAGTREAWAAFLKLYPSGFYTELARVQLNKIAADDARAAAAEKAKQAEAEKARLAAEGAKAGEQAKAAREAKAAEDARIAAEKQRQSEQAKADAAERVRASAERAAAEKLAKEKAEADAKAIEEARKAAEKEAERVRVAALSADAGRMLTQQELSRSLQAELRRVGCQTAAAGDEWTAASRRSLELFNKHANTKLDVKLASLDALDAVKGKQARICPLICERGFRASGGKCQKIEAVNAAAKRQDLPQGRDVESQPAPQSADRRIHCTNTGCVPVPSHCQIVNVHANAGQPSGYVKCN